MQAKKLLTKTFLKYLGMVTEKSLPYSLRLFFFFDSSLFWRDFLLITLLFQYIIFRRFCQLEGGISFLMTTFPLIYLVEVLLVIISKMVHGYTWSECFYCYLEFMERGGPFWPWCLYLSYKILGQASLNSLNWF